jgi:glucose-6-phosphate isomerase
VIDDGLEIPESNREIALHLRAMRREVEQINNRMDDFEGSVTQKNIRFQDLIFSVVGGIVVYLCTQFLPLNH